MSQEEVCVVGAGQAGLAAASALSRARLPFRVFERGSAIGGLWRLDNDSGLSAAYPSLRMNTSKQRSAFSDYPMPLDYPIYPSHREFLQYLERYAKSCDLYARMRFNACVQSMSPVGAAGREGWIIQTADGKSEAFRAVIVANGHNWKPRMPDVTGQFTGRIQHSFYFRTGDDLQGQSVLVIGLGASGADIAVQLTCHARRVICSARSVLLLPKILCGRPTDHWIASPSVPVPRPIRAALSRLIVGLCRGSLVRFGIRDPQAKFTQVQPTLSDDLITLVRAGQVIMKPTTTRFDNRHVYFADGSRELVDSVVCATGYDVSIPFLDPSTERSILSRLYLRTISPDFHNLMFVGMFAVAGPSLPICELQARWCAGILSHCIRAPSTVEMGQELENGPNNAQTAKNAIFVDWHFFARRLRRELQRR